MKGGIIIGGGHRRPGRGNLNREGRLADHAYFNWCWVALIYVCIDVLGILQRA